MSRLFGYLGILRTSRVIAALVQGLAQSSAPGSLSGPWRPWKPLWDITQPAPGPRRGNLQFATRQGTMGTPWGHHHLSPPYPPCSISRTDQPLATWVDQLKENPVESTVTTVVLQPGTVVNCGQLCIPW